MTAIIWRDLKVSLNSVFGLIGQLVVPLFFLLFFATVLSSNMSTITVSGKTLRYVEFFTPGLFGYVTFLLFGLSFAFIRMDKQSGMLVIIYLSVTKLTGYYWGKFFTQLILTVIKIIVLSLVAYFLTGRLISIDPFFLAVFLYTIFCSVAVWYSLGLLAGVFIQRDDLREVVMILVTLPLTFASSMYYDISIAPPPIRWLATVNPLTYICDLLRGCYIEHFPPDYLTCLFILTLFAVNSIIFALLSLRYVKL